jgi:hypothetical protein
VEAAIQEPNCGKAEGIDGISAEMLKALGCKARNEIYESFQEMYTMAGGL